MPTISAAQRQLIRSGNEILRFGRNQRVRPADFESVPVALFIHGFTADSTCMELLMQQFSDNGFTSLAYNYACFNGIDVAAKSLIEILEGMDELCNGGISKNRLVVIGHSMGGLVARALISLHAGHRFVRKLISMGTPHDGTLTEQQYIEYLLAWSESISGVTAGGYSAKCRSALQLIGRDDPEFLLQRLKKIPCPHGVVQFYSVSGGLPFLEFGRGGYASRLANAWIQKSLKGVANDGLVAEVSSNLAQPMFKDCAPNCRHNSSYADYPRVNHTHLISNQVIAVQAIKFANIKD